MSLGSIHQRIALFRRHTFGKEFHNVRSALILANGSRRSFRHNGRAVMQSGISCASDRDPMHICRAPLLMEGVPFVGDGACAHNLLQKGRPLIMRHCRLKCTFTVLLLTILWAVSNELRQFLSWSVLKFTLRGPYTTKLFCVPIKTFPSAAMGVAK